MRAQGSKVSVKGRDLLDSLELDHDVLLRVARQLAQADHLPLPNEIKDCLNVLLELGEASDCEVVET